MAKIISEDESWVYGYDPVTKIHIFQSKTSNFPRHKKARQSNASIKVMLIVFFDIESIVRSEFLPRETTMNSEFYLWVLECLRKNVQRKKNWPMAYFFITTTRHAQVAFNLRVFGLESILVCQQLFYSPDSAPCDFWLFLKINKVLKGKQFDTIPDIDIVKTQQLKPLLKEAF